MNMEIKSNMRKLEGRKIGKLENVADVVWLTLKLLFLDSHVLYANGIFINHVTKTTQCVEPQSSISDQTDPVLIVGINTKNNISFRKFYRVCLLLYG